ncbi:hypothetical protein FJ959_18055 [Mesorhizobium sp. B2-2-4]|uniref:hypothetical protein n=2 Tax=unclassified Mesorhizobium TaxID=325217 RepID=UPI00112AEB6E|nr:MULTISPECIES: hypothetical protein [unclassified Mesorhizobium]TPJ97101.1 hypothetical protein FJ489_11705 [Mesorhizobium sp. B2-5-12]TPM55315.1 hypothetical protein FJ959_18055 [Mesorhizobium sp. B2-2-4]TPN59937.1 hypothetical protein FJ984_30980 [Mesorhizobium sp. B1-1-3]
MAMSLAKVAIALDVSPNSVLQMVEEGLLPRPRVWRRRKLWRVAEIDAALAEWPTDGDEEGEVGEPGRWDAD